MGPKAAWEASAPSCGLRPLTSLSSQNASNEQRQVPGLAVEARALPGSPHRGLSSLLQQVCRAGGPPTPQPALWVLLDSWSLLDPTVDPSPRACRAGLGKASHRPLVLKGQGSIAPSSPVLALSSWLSPRFWRHLTHQPSVPSILEVPFADKLRVQGLDRKEASPSREPCFHFELGEPLSRSDSASFRK